MYVYYVRVLLLTFLTQRLTRWENVVFFFSRATSTLFPAKNSYSFVADKSVRENRRTALYGTKKPKEIFIRL